MGKDDQAYFARDAAAANIHRELSLRYSLKVLLPGQAGESDDARPIGEPRRLQRHPATVAERRRPTHRPRRNHA